MRDAVLLAAALACCVAGMGWLALAMEAHWAQVRRRPLARRGAVRFRVLGGAGLLASLALCLLVDHVSMAALVWVMALAAGALVIAFALTWRPAWLGPLAWFGDAGEGAPRVARGRAAGTDLR